MEDDKNLKDEAISEQELIQIHQKRDRCEMALLKAQKALAESQSFDLDYKNYILELFIKNKMSFEDKIDEQTGKILRADSK